MAANLRKRLKKDNVVGLMFLYLVGPHDLKLENLYIFTSYSYFKKNPFLQYIVNAYKHLGSFCFSRNATVCF